MRPALIVVLAIGFCGTKEEDAAQVDPPAAQEEAAPAEVPADAAPSEPAAPAVEPELAGFDAALARAIVRIDDGRFRVDPFVATLVAEHLAETGGEPTFRRVARKQTRAGVPNGFRLGKIEKGSLFHRLGLRPGDIVTKVGSAAPPGPKKLRELLETIEQELVVELTRDGNAVTLRYELAGEQSWHDYLEKTAGRKFEDDVEAEKDEPVASNTTPSSGGGGTPSGGGKPTGGSSASSSKPTGGSSSSTTPESIPVSCSSSSSCTVAKWYFDKVVSSSSQMRSQAKISAASGGYKLAWVKPGSGVHKLLFRAGDIITRVNGRDLSNQLEALSLYAGLKSTRTYTVKYVRGGKVLSKTIRIV